MNLDRTVIESLLLLNNKNLISDEIQRKLLENCFEILAKIGKTSENLNNSLPTSSKPDQMKELEANLLIITLQFVRHSMDKTSVENYLKNSKFTDRFVSTYSELYEKYRKMIETTLNNLGRNNSHLIDVNCSVNYTVKSSSIEESSDGPLFRIEMVTEDQGLRNSLEFTCNLEEMHDLVQKFREMVRHADNLAKI